MYITLGVKNNRENADIKTASEFPFAVSLKSMLTDIVPPSFLVVYLVRASGETWYHISLSHYLELVG